MVNVQDIVIYTYQHYPAPLQLGVSKLMKLLFIADYYQVKGKRQPISNFDWTATINGPFSALVMEVLMQTPEYFTVEMHPDTDGENESAPKQLIVFQISNPDKVELADRYTENIDKVIRKIHPMVWQELADFLYEDTPIAQYEIGKEINLFNLSKFRSKDPGTKKVRSQKIKYVGKLKNKKWALARAH